MSRSYYIIFQESSLENVIKQATGKLINVSGMIYITVYIKNTMSVRLVLSNDFDLFTENLETHFWHVTVSSKIKLVLYKDIGYTMVI